MEIPLQLKQEQFRFIKVAAKNKKPIETDWQNNTNYKYNDTNLLTHINNGGNYGIATGFGNLLVIDFDDENLQAEKINLLPPTFSVKSGRGLMHLYYIVDNPKSWKIMDEDKNTLVDFQGTGKQIICPGSTHPNGNTYQVINNTPITIITREEINKVFRDVWLKNELPKIKPTHNYGEDKIRDEIKQKIKVPEILSSLGIDTNQNPTNCPFHDSKAGHCLGFNDQVWHCFHCEDKGDIFSIIMKKQNMTFPQAKNYLANKYNIKKDPSNFTNAYQQIKEKITEKTNWLEIATDFIKTQPLYYDKSLIWWFWDYQQNKWTIIDETDLLNSIDENGELNTIQFGKKQQLLEALRRKARKNKPKDLKQTWIQFKNKIIDFETNETFEASPEYFATNPIPRDIGITEDTPIMDKIFEEWVGKDYVSTLYEIIAFCLAPTYFLHRIFVFVGSGRNGKSCFLNLISNFVGNYNICSTELDLIMNSRFERAKLYKKLVCQMGETNFNSMNRTSMIKRLSGNDVIGFELKGKTPFDDWNYAKILISTNSLPATDDKTEGFYRRWVIIDFNAKFSEKKDVLKDIPEQEYVNLGNKCVRLLKKLWIDREFCKEGSIDERTQRYEAHSNPLNKFVDENCVIDINGFVFKFEFRKEFEQFCKGKGLRVWNDTELGRNLKDVYGFEEKQKQAEWQTSDGIKPYLRVWVGLKWKNKAGLAEFTPFSIPVNKNEKSIKGIEYPANSANPALKLQKLVEILALYQKDNIDLLITVFGQEQIDKWIQNGTINQNPAGTYRLL